MEAEAKGLLDGTISELEKTAFSIGDGIAMLEGVKKGMVPGSYESLGMQNRIKELVNQQEELERTLLEIRAAIPK